MDADGLDANDRLFVDVFRCSMDVGGLHAKPNGSVIDLGGYMLMVPVPVLVDSTPMLLDAA